MTKIQELTKSEAKSAFYTLLATYCWQKNSNVRAEAFMKLSQKEGIYTERVSNVYHEAYSMFRSSSYRWSHMRLWLFQLRQHINQLDEASPETQETHIVRLYVLNNEDLYLNLLRGQPENSLVRQGHFIEKQFRKELDAIVTAPFNSFKRNAVSCVLLDLLKESLTKVDWVYIAEQLTDQ